MKAPLCTSCLWLGLDRESENGKGRWVGDGKESENKGIEVKARKRTSKVHRHRYRQHSINPRTLHHLRSTHGLEEDGIPYSGHFQKHLGEGHSVIMHKLSMRRRGETFY